MSQGNKLWIESSYICIESRLLERNILIPCFVKRLERNYFDIFTYKINNIINKEGKKYQNLYLTGK